MKQSEQSNAGWYFLGGVIIAYAIVGIIKPDAIMPSLKFFMDIIQKIIPILIIIFALMALINRFVSARKLAKYFGKKSGARGWAAAIITGIISTGPVYMWYPLLNDLQKKGVRSGLIAAFLYNRAVKIPLLPLMIFYFGLAYTLVLSAMMIIASIFQGLIVERIIKIKTQEV